MCKLRNNIRRQIITISEYDYDVEMSLCDLSNFIIMNEHYNFIIMNEHSIECLPPEYDYDVEMSLCNLSIYFH